MIYERDMDLIFLSYVWDVSGLFLRYSWEFSKMNIHETDWDMSEICIWDIPEVCLKYVWDILEMWQRNIRNMF